MPSNGCRGRTIRGEVDRKRAGIRFRHPSWDESRDDESLALGPANPMGDMMAQAAPLYLDDLAVGQTFRSDTVTVDPVRLKAFAAEFDPQPFHLDDQAAAASVFGGLVASGWHTAALTMKLLVAGSLKVAGGLIGAGV